MFSRVKNVFSTTGKDGKKPGDAPPVTANNSTSSRSTIVDTSSPSIAQSMEVVDDTVDKIDLRIHVLEKQKDSHTNDAKAYLVKKDQEKAKACLFKKKRCDEQILDLMKKKDNLISVQFSMQNQSLDKEIHTVLIILRKQMEAMQKEMSLASVEDEIEKLQNAMEDAEDISRLLTEPLNQNHSLDEDDVLDDMELLQRQIEEDEKRKEPVHNTQAVPQHELPAVARNPQVEKDDDEDLDAQLRRLEFE